MILEGCLLDLKTPKMVHFENPRLKIIYNIAVFAACVGLLLWLILSESWSSEHDVKGDFMVTSWTSSTAQNAQALMHSKTVVTRCNKTDMYDYQYKQEEQESWTCTDYMCPSICDNGRSGPGCVLFGDIIIREPTGLFFTTSIEEETLPSEISTDTPHKIHYLLPLEGLYSMTFSYQYAVRDSRVKSMSNLFMAEGFQGSSADTLTLLLDPDGQEVRAVGPGDVALTFNELLLLTGSSGVLDRPQPSLVKDSIKEALYREGPVPRVTGVAMQISLICTNPSNSRLKYKVRHWSGNVCTAQFHMDPPAWVRKIHTHSLYGVPTRVTRYGVRIRFSTAVHLRYFNLTSLINFLINAIVLIQLLPKFFRAFILYSMGHLSAIYKSTLDEHFSLRDNVSALAMKLMISGMAHAQLKDTPNGISLKRISSSLAETLCDFTELDQHELHDFSLYCFAGSLTAQESHSFSQRRILRPSMAKCVDEILRGNRFARRASFSDCIDRDLKIDLASFLTTYHISDSINVTQAVQLFDRDRQISWIEDFFTPAFLRAFYRESPAALQELQRSICDAENCCKIDMAATPTDALPTSQDGSESSSRCSDISQAADRVHGNHLKDEEMNGTWQGGHEKEQNQNRLHCGVVSNPEPNVRKPHKIESATNLQEDVLKRIEKLEACIEKLMPDLRCHSDLHRAPPFDMTPSALHSPKSFVMMHDHELEDNSTVGPQASQTSRQFVPGTLTWHLKDQQKKLVSARELLLEVATYHDDCLKEVMGSMESLAVKMREMDIMIQTEQLDELEDEPRAAAPKNRQIVSGDVLSSHPSDSILELSTLRTSARGTTDSLALEDFAAELNMESTMQRVEDTDKKVKRFFIEMLKSTKRDIMKSTRKEIANLESTLRAVIEHHLGDSPAAHKSHIRAHNETVDSF